MRRKDDDNYYLEFEEEDNKIRFESKFNDIDESENRNKKNNIVPIKFKWILISLLLLAIYLFYDFIMLEFLSMLQRNPTFYKYFLYVQSNIVNQTLLGLFFSSIFGAVFFLILPSEALFIYFLNSTDYLEILIITIMVFGNLTGLIFNYIFGRLLGQKVLKMIFKTNFDKYKAKVFKYGGIIIFVGNIIPGPIEVLSVFYGGFKFNFKRYIFLAFIGRLIKYVILLLLFIFFWDQIIVYYKSFFNIFGGLL